MVLKKDIIVVEKNYYDKEAYENANKNITENSYKDENISIEISYDRKYNSNIYVADIKISDIKYLKTAFANNMYGRNIIGLTTEIAKENNAIFAVNGDYYGYRDYGFVIRNGVKYKDKARPTEKDSCLLIYSDGNFKIINERESNLNSEIKKASKNNLKIEQAFTFGPSLVIDKKAITTNSEPEDIALNPRTAIGIVEPLHYIIVCVDGRTSKSTGITVAQLAEYMLSKNCTTAYNLDGGNSTTMYFNGRLINAPSQADGKERPVSDIVYIGY